MTMNVGIPNVADIAEAKTKRAISGAMPDRQRSNLQDAID